MLFFNITDCENFGVLNRINEQSFSLKVMSILKLELNLTQNSLKLIQFDLKIVSRCCKSVFLN